MRQNDLWLFEAFYPTDFRIRCTELRGVAPKESDSQLQIRLSYYQAVTRSRNRSSLDTLDSSAEERSTKASTLYRSEKAYREELSRLTTRAKSGHGRYPRRCRRFCRRADVCKRTVLMAHR